MDISATANPAPAEGGPGPRWQWLVTDLDGTLVDRSLRIVPRSARALARFRERGGTVIIATGRNEEAVDRYYRQLDLDTPMILHNGARVVAADGTRLRDRDLGAAWPRFCATVLPDLSAGVGVVGFAGRHAYLVRDAPAVAEYARRDQITPLPAPEGFDAATGVTKVLLVGEVPGLPGVPELVGAACPQVTLVRSEDTYLEMLPPGATKGAALRWLAGQSGVDLTRVAAIGDNPNDLDMLTVAGLGAAVGDGHPGVRGAADMVTGACADGAVADLVDRLLADSCC